jgi:hypothetical protein
MRYNFADALEIIMIINGNGSRPDDDTCQSNPTSMNIGLAIKETDPAACR